MASKKEQSQTPCRNILIHGYCKYADKGCIFKHDTEQQKPSTSATASPKKAPIVIKKRLNADSPSFTPTFSPAKAVDAPAFIPKGAAPSSGNNGHNNGSTKFNPESSTFSPVGIRQQFVPMGAGAADGTPAAGMSPAAVTADFSAMSVGGPPEAVPAGAPLDHVAGPGMPAQPMDEFAAHAAGGMYGGDYAAAAAAAAAAHQAPQFPLQYHLYAPQNRSRPRELLKPNQRLVHDFFINGDLRQELQRKNAATLQTLPGSTLPEFVHVYHSLVPLDTNFGEQGRDGVFGGHATWVYRATSNFDGRAYCLRRIEGFRLTNERAMRAVKQWAEQVASPNVVPLREAFTTRAFGDDSLVFVYDYFPLATTLYDMFLSSASPYTFDKSGALDLDEREVWNYGLQLLAALGHVHRAGLAARVVDPRRVLLIRKGRVRLNAVGILDVLKFGSADASEQTATLQAQDIAAVGRLLLCLACKSTTASQDAPKSLAAMKHKYSDRLCDFVKSLIDASEPQPEHEPEHSADALLHKFADQLVPLADSALYLNDELEGELSKELENGRLVRLMVKLNFITERPEQEHDRNWSEAGDRFLIKLFRDQVFHQVDELGKPVIDLAHVLASLNKLDAGIDENILLVSRDEQNCYIVSYKELKDSIDAAFRELSK